MYSLYSYFMGIFCRSYKSPWLSPGKTCLSKNFIPHQLITSFFRVLRSFSNRVKSGLSYSTITEYPTSSARFPVLREIISLMRTVLYWLRYLIFYDFWSSNVSLWYSMRWQCFQSLSVDVALRGMKRTKVFVESKITMLRKEELCKTKSAHKTFSPSTSLKNILISKASLYSQVNHIRICMNVASFQFTLVKNWERFSVTDSYTTHH